MRIGIPFALAALTTASTFSRFPIFPGLMRILSAPLQLLLRRDDNQNEYQRLMEY